MDHMLIHLIETAGSLLAGACLLRALAWGIRLPARDPLHRFAIAATDWLVAPLRRVLRPAGQVDLASLTGACLIALIAACVWAASTGFSVGLGSILLRTVVWVMKWSVYLVAGLVLVQAILSWVNPQAPIAPTLERLTQPLLVPIRRVVPTVGGVDLSPLVLLVLAQVALALLDSLFHQLILG